MSDNALREKYVEPIWLNIEKTIIEVEEVTVVGKVKHERKLVLQKYNDNNKDDENVIFALITKIYSEEEIDKFTEDYNAEEKAKHAQKKAEQEQEEELFRLEKLFKTKLDIFNIEAIANSENKELKSKIRRSKSDAEAIANAVILMMQEDDADV